MIAFIQTLDWQHALFFSFLIAVVICAIVVHRAEQRPPMATWKPERRWRRGEHVHCFDQLGEPNTPGWLRCQCGLTYTEHEVEEAEKNAARQIW